MRIKSEALNAFYRSLSEWSDTLTDPDSRFRKAIGDAFVAQIQAYDVPVLQTERIRILATVGTREDLMRAHLTSCASHIDYLELELAGYKAILEAGDHHFGRIIYPIQKTVRKKSGSWWEGRVVGFYATEQTPKGVCVQLDRPNGPVQIYPASALELVEG